jgi:hypothetical protein
MSEDYVQKLMQARDREVAQRRKVADSLAGEYRRGHTEDISEAFINIQNAIEAIERAIEHERALAGPHIPQS